jgi:hypothetical protein
LFEVDPAILIVATPCHSRQALDEIEDALWQMPLLAQHRLDNFGTVVFTEALIFEELVTVLIGAGNNSLSR